MRRNIKNYFFGSRKIKRIMSIVISAMLLVTYLFNNISDVNIKEAEAESMYSGISTYRSYPATAAYVISVSPTPENDYDYWYSDYETEEPAATPYPDYDYWYDVYETEEPAAASTPDYDYWYEYDYETEEPAFTSYPAYTEYPAADTPYPEYTEYPAPVQTKEPYATSTPWKTTSSPVRRTSTSRPAYTARPSARPAAAVTRTSVTTSTSIELKAKQKLKFTNGIKNGKAFQKKYDHIVNLNWSLVKNAVTYKIYRGTSESNMQKYQETEDGFYVDKNVLHGKNYCYMIETSITAGNHISLNRSEIQWISVHKKLVKPKLKVKRKKGKNGKKGKLLFSFKKSEGNYMQVQGLSRGRWLKVKKMSGKIKKSTLIKSTLSNRPFKLRVRTYKKENGKKVKSPWKVVYVK